LKIKNSLIAHAGVSALFGTPQVAGRRNAMSAKLWRQYSAMNARIKCFERAII